MTRRLLALTLVALFLYFSPTANADTGEDLHRLHQLRLAAQKTLGDFYMFNGMEGDQRYAQKIDEALQAAHGYLQQIGAMPGDASRALRERLDEQWAGYESALNVLIGQIRNRGYPELQLIADLAERNQQLMELSGELYERIQQESGKPVPPLTQQSRAQSLLMQAIAVDYASRSASVGGSFFGNPESVRPIDELAREFAGQLERMTKAPQNSPQIARDLDSVSTKWRYIEKSLRNYNQNSVPFLVNKYSDSIIEELETVAQQYAVANL
ncbi:hypothetical protein [Zestomonas thermotolerans]|uniref:hypothetical protein n=1 Tax=Zestomonas thermotolerans TaxID=157784 RepID=UPI00036650DA|nr:hypothetical protein [Pseudomonas thermotolerans]MBO2509993.1 hypothetical protein [Gammaproteobacteria bacterium]